MDGQQVLYPTESQVVEEEEPPLKRTVSAAVKRPFMSWMPLTPPEEEEDEQFGEVEDIDSDSDGDEDALFPDLGLYFARFPGFSKENQIKLCRSYATYLVVSSKK